MINSDIIMGHIVASRGIESSTVLVDFLCLTIGLWLVGGAQSPFQAFFLFHVIIASVRPGRVGLPVPAGFTIAVPAMIYLIGVPTAVAAGSELYLAMYMGAWGALNYAFQGMVDLRLTMLLYLGSLVGIFVGAYGVKVVNEVMIRLVTAVIILLCVISRAIAVPIYLRQVGWLDFDPALDTFFNLASKVLLFAAGLSGCLMILYNVVKAYRQRRQIHLTLLKAPELSETV